MKFFGIAILSLATVVSSAPAWPPAFCDGNGCPRYTVKETTDDYEVREYEASSWVSTKLSCDHGWFAQARMFWRLFRYIQGSNDKSMKIDMTAPVIMTVTPGNKPGCYKNMTMSFWNAPEVGTPPAPTESTVFLHNMDKMTVYVKSFGGFANDSKNKRYAQLLASALDDDEVKYNKDMFYSAGYDSPYKRTNRHNEVWYIGA